MVDFEKLKQLAQAATAGPWITWSEEGPSKHGGELHSVCHHIGDMMSEDHYCVAEARGEDKEHASANARYIAAANPTVVMEMVENAIEMQAEIKRLRETLVYARNCLGDEEIDFEPADMDDVVMHVIEEIDEELELPSTTEVDANG